MENGIQLKLSNRCLSRGYLIMARTKEGRTEGRMKRRFRKEFGNIRFTDKRL